MDRQAKFKAQTANSRFADGSADRLPVAGTVLRGTAIDPKNVFSSQPKFYSDAYTTGKLPNGEWECTCSSWIKFVDDAFR